MANPGVLGRMAVKWSACLCVCGRQPLGIFSFILLLFYWDRNIYMLQHDTAV